MYKVGDEVWVNGKIVAVEGISTKFYNIEVLDSLHNTVCVSTNCVTDKTYESGLNDAWELAKKIVLGVSDGGIDADEVFEIFGYGTYNAIRNLSCEEALAKIEAYEKEKEIKVGDVVGSNGVYGVVARKEKENLYVMWSDGSCGIDFNPESLYKTGKHIDIESLLRQIGE